MLDKTVDLIEKFVVLKRFQTEVDNNYDFINRAIIYLENKILGQIEEDKIRQEQIAKDKKRIKLKQEQRLKEATLKNEV